MLERAAAATSAPPFRSWKFCACSTTTCCRYDPKNPRWPERDRFILSKGHGCLALYVLLAEKGFFPEAELWKFCKPDGILGGHPEYGKVPGVEASTGSLGHGLAHRRRLGAERAASRRPTTACSSSPATANATKARCGRRRCAPANTSLSNLTVLVDYNKQQSYGTTYEVLDLEPFADKWRAFGFAVRGGGRPRRRAVARGAGAVPFDPDKPSAIICHTIKGKGVELRRKQPELASQDQGHATRKSSRCWPSWRRSLMRKTCLDMVYELAKQDPRDRCSSARTWASARWSNSRPRCPTVSSWKASARRTWSAWPPGLALEGKIVYVNTIATFLTRRCFEQVVLDLCLHNANVRLIGNGGGVVYAPLGPTHRGHRRHRHSPRRCRT